MDTVKLNNGVEMPLMGMGTYPLNKFKLSLFIMRAVSEGGRAVDTADAYYNERWVGIGLKLCPLRRSDVFITTKLSNAAQRRGDVKTAILSSLKKLGTKYVDLYLMHWPQESTFLDSWKQMEVVYKEGYARAIGVCNFHEHHLTDLLEVADVMPAVNQIELHPLLSQVSLRSFCEKNDIQVQAYSPLARMNEKLIKNDVLLELAEKYMKTVPQIILNWLYCKKIISIPKTGNIRRLKENLESMDFSMQAADIVRIDALNENFRVRFDPDNCNFSKL